CIYEDEFPGTFWRSDLYKIETGKLEKIDMVTIIGRFKSFGTRPTTRVAALILNTHDIVYTTATFAPPFAWTDHPWEHAVNPFTHEAWTQAEFDTLQIGPTLGMVRGVGWGQRGYCTQIFARVRRGIICPP
ncbi:unnamed protein product, partial [marine sediment metagenome]